MNKGNLSIVPISNIEIGQLKGDSFVYTVEPVELVKNSVSDAVYGKCSHLSIV